jgi:hypothetical protein
LNPNLWLPYSDWMEKAQSIIEDKEEFDKFIDQLKSLPDLKRNDTNC